jgi:hypothetical protein
MKGRIKNEFISIYLDEQQATELKNVQLSAIVNFISEFLIFSQQLTHSFLMSLLFSE